MKLVKVLKPLLILCPFMFIGVVSCTSSSDTSTPAPTVQLRIADDKNIDNNAVTIGTEDEEAVVRVRPCGRFATSFMSVLVEGEVDATYTLSQVEVPAPYYDSTTAANNTNTRSVTATKGENSSTFDFNIIIQPCVVSSLLGSGTENDPWQIDNDLRLNLVSELVNVANSVHADDHYVLTADIDLKIAGAPWSSEFGFTPIGTTLVVGTDDNAYTNRFAGTFDCQGNIISNLYISNTNNNNTMTNNGVYKGLFGSATNGTVIRNCGLVNVDVLAKETVGGLIGNAQGVRIERSFVQGVIRSTDDPIGGLAGIAGLNTMIVESYVAGEVTNISSGPRVTGSLDTGGLIGRSAATVINSYTTVNLMGAASTGGLIGNDVGIGSITNSYAAGSITSLAGTDLDMVYGLTGSASTTTNSYWDTSIGHPTSPGGTGRTTAQMQVAAPVATGSDAVYVDWDKNMPGGTILSGEDQVWNFTARAYPRLRRVPCPTRQHTSASFTGNCSDPLPPQ